MTALISTIFFAKVLSASDNDYLNLMLVKSHPIEEETI